MIKIVCVGKLKEKPMKILIEEYSKRISGFSKIEVIECQESKLKDETSDKLIERIKIEEGKNILQLIHKDDFVCLCDVSGVMISSTELSIKLNRWIDTTIKDIVFVIGGSQGVSEDVRNRSDFRLSFSKLTFPHQLMRVILLEQIYRSFMINSGRAYHK